MKFLKEGEICNSRTMYASKKSQKKKLEESLVYHE